jgi:hypothetical protein
MWLEFLIAGAVGAFATFLVVEALLHGHRDKRHGGAILIVGAVFLLVGAAAFALGALGLRSRTRVGWIAQVFPIAVVSWLLWDILSHGF